MEEVINIEGEEKYTIVFTNSFGRSVVSDILFNTISELSEYLEGRGYVDNGGVFVKRARDSSNLKAYIHPLILRK